MRKKNFLLFIILLYTGISCDAQKTDTLAEVKVISGKTGSITSSALPVQILDRNTLASLNSRSVGDAAKFLAGAFVKDYGGIGGLKTVSIRNLGASHTTVLYNGIVMSDARGGQIDLGKIPIHDVAQIELYNSGSPDILQTARAFSGGGTVEIQTASLQNIPAVTSIKTGITTGSFGLVNPFLDFTTGNKKRSTGISFNYADAKGNYKFPSYEQADTSFRRINSDIKSLVVALNQNFQINDSNAIHVSGYMSDSKRGLPGSLVIGNPYSSQRLDENNSFIQATWKNHFSKKSAFMFSGKLSRDKSFYIDPSYPNSAHLLENKFTQKEFYMSAAYALQPIKSFSFTQSLDYFTNRLLRTDTFFINFAQPVRQIFLANSLFQFRTSRIEITANALFSKITERVRFGDAAKDINRLSPSVAFSVRPINSVPLRFRFFYKDIFRVPGYDELYYTNVGNTNLRPEFARQFNTGLTYSFKPGKLFKETIITLDGYKNRITDQILAVPRQNLFQWSAENIGKVSAEGIDISMINTMQPIHNLLFSSRVGYTLQKAFDISDPTSNKYKQNLPYTPRHSGSMHLACESKNIRAGYNILYSSSRFRQGLNIKENKVQGFIQHDLSLNYNIKTKGITSIDFLAELNNIFNQHYEIVKFYPMPGTSFRIGIRATFIKQHKTNKHV